MVENASLPPKAKQGDPDRALDLAIRSYANTAPKTEEIIERAKAFNGFIASKQD
jgi:hypothetical protein